MIGTGRTERTADSLGRLLDREEVAKWLGVSPRTLDRWHALRRGPPRVQLSGGKVRYRAKSLVDWIEQQERRQATIEGRVQ